MPFHHTPFRAAVQRLRPAILPRPQWLPHRGFHSSRALLRDDDPDASKNHYETLNVRPDASQADIKKSFYTLSKAHHPDHNPSDRHAAKKRFMRLSEAYAVLSRPDRRARYDRDTLPRHAHPHPSRSGSYASTGPAGGRPASGLSRRRSGTFTGPPPSSFFRNAAAAAGAKRRAAGGAAHEGQQAAGGMGPGAEPRHDSSSSGGMGAGEVPHFDHVRHERALRRRREEQLARRAGGYEDLSPGGADAGGLWVRFAVVTGIVMFAAYVPYWFAGGGGRAKKRKEGA